MRIRKTNWTIGSPADLVRDRGVMMPTPGSKQARLFEKQGIVWTAGNYGLINDLMKHFAAEIDYNLWMKIIQIEYLLKESEKINFLWQLFDGCIICNPNQNPDLILHATNEELIDGILVIRRWAKEIEQQIIDNPPKYDVFSCKKRAELKKVAVLQDLAEALEKYCNIRTKNYYENLGKFTNDFPK